MRKTLLIGFVGALALAIPAGASASSNTATGLSDTTWTQSFTPTYLGAGNNPATSLGNKYLGVSISMGISGGAGGFPLAPSPHTTKLGLPAGSTWFGTAGAARYGCDPATTIVDAPQYPGGPVVGTMVDPNVKVGRVKQCKKGALSVLGSTSGVVKGIVAGPSILTLPTSGDLYITNAGGLMLSASLKVANPAVPGGVATVASSVIPGTYDSVNNSLDFAVPHLGGAANCANAVPACGAPPVTLSSLTFTLNQSAKLIRLAKCTQTSAPKVLPKTYAPLTTTGQFSFRRAGLINAPLAFTPTSYSDGFDADANEGQTFITVTDSQPCLP